MRPSRRYLVPAVVVCLLAAVPVWSGRLRPASVDPCADPGALRELRAIPGTQAGDERVDKLTSDLFQWSVGTLLDGRGERTALEVHVVRDFQGGRFFQRPFALAAPLEPESQSTDRIESELGSLVVHRVSDGTSRITHGVEQFAAFTFLYGNRPVSSAVGAKLRHGLDELLQGRRPLTLLLVAGPAPVSHADALRTRADHWLRDAAERYAAVCGGPA